MTLFAASLITGLVLVGTGALLAWNNSSVAALARSFPRSQRAAWVTMGAGSVWTLYLVTQLGEAEFGNYKGYLFIGFALLALLSFRYVPDFLSVRGACIMALLVANVLLTASYMQFDAPSHLVLNVFAYVMIVLALYLAVSPFRVRDFVQWLFQRPHRARVLGAACGVYGLVLLGTAFA